MPHTNELNDFFSQHNIFFDFVIFLQYNKIIVTDNLKLVQAFLE